MVTAWTPPINVKPTMTTTEAMMMIATGHQGGDNTEEESRNDRNEDFSLEMNE